MEQKKIFWIVFLVFIFGSIGVYAIDSSTISNKIFLSPFYRSAMSLNTNYTYTLNVNPPDKVGSVLSAIINLQVYLTPTVTFNIWVNGTSCNTASYQVSTTFAGSGQGMITFDCSNIITKAGVYSVTLRPTQANTGASTMWLDLTYTNQPSDYIGSVGNVNESKIKVSGTEYNVGDEATIFLQLLDNFNNPITNGICYLDIWYPNNASNVHPFTVYNLPMLQALGDNGIYYYDITAPNILGVYMLSAKCSYSFNWIWIYPETEVVYYPIRQINSGSWQGSSIVLNSRSDSLYERCDGSIAQPCSANYTFNISAYGNVTNISNINVYFAGESDTNARVLTMSYWNETSFIDLPNTLTFTGTGNTVPTSYDEFLSNVIPLSAIYNGNTIKLKLTTAGSVRIFQNWLSLTLSSSTGTIQTIKGSSEMHITNFSYSTAQKVWNYYDRQLTRFDFNVTAQNLNETKIAESVWGWEGSIADNILTKIAEKIWQFVGGVAEIIT